MTVSSHESIHLIFSSSCECEVNLDWKIWEKCFLVENKFTKGISLQAVVAIFTCRIIFFA